MKLVLCLIALGLMAGCSHSVLVKDCKEVSDTEYSKCKTIKPWE